MSAYNLQIEQIVGVYLPLLFVAIYALFAYLDRLSSAGRAGAFAYLCVGVIGMIACTFAVFFTNDPGWHTLADNATLVFSSFWVSAQCLFSYWFYRADYKMPAYIPALAFIFPCVLAIVALSPLYSVAVEVYHMIQETGSGTLPAIDFVFPVWCVWELAATIYDCLIIVTTAFVVVIGHAYRTKFNMLPSFLVMAALGLTIAGAGINLLEVNSTNLNPTVVCAGLALILYYLAILAHTRSFYARYARLASFRFLKDFVVVFEKSGRVADFNPSADRWFSSIGIDLRNFTFTSLIETLKQAGGVVTPAWGMDEGEDISFTHNGLLMVLNMRVFDLSGRREKSKHGTIAFFFDVTQNRGMFRMLEKKAGVDALSGLPNRMAYEGAKARYDLDPYHLPLSVVMCDLNGLKTTNDNLGHKYGDLLIQTTASICEAACEKGNFVGRIGGDEFVFLLSRTDEEKARNFVEQLKATMAENAKTLPFTVSMAMGAAAKCQEEESLEEVVNLADERMYEDKKAMKGEAPR